MAFQTVFSEWISDLALKRATDWQYWIINIAALLLT